MLFKIFIESIVQAFHELKSHKMRSFLSLLGIGIGIFSIILVLSAVDSMERDIKKSFAEMGEDVIYIQKWPWSFDDPNYEWWEYWKRPNPTIKEMKLIQERVHSAEFVSIQCGTGGKTVQYKSEKVKDIVLVGVSKDFENIYDLKFSDGRFFTHGESTVGANSAVIGHMVANSLFKEGVDPLGKQIKIQGRKFKVIGVLEKEGKSIIGGGWDERVTIPYTSIIRFIDPRRVEPEIAIKKASHASIEDLKGELTATLRAKRMLRPKEKDNFAVNQLAMLSRQLDAMFGVVNLAGWFIGILAIIVGCFGIANIMFVTVKERTGIIGVKKSLGARNIYILLEFLVESIILCLIGGMIGLFLVWILTLVATSSIGIEFVVAQKNIIIAVVISVTVGVIAGIIPAYQAATMDPVEAIRS